MKHLAVIYGDKILFDGDVAEITWTESDNAVSLKAVMQKSSVKSASSIIDLLTNAASKNNSENKTNNL